MTTETVLVTGANSGIGLHLAHRFDAEGHPFFIAAPDAGELKAVPYGSRYPTLGAQFRRTRETSA